MALGSTQPLTEMSTRNLPGGKGRPAHKTDNFTAIYEPIVYKMWEPRRLRTLWAFTAWVTVLLCKPEIPYINWRQWVPLKYWYPFTKATRRHIRENCNYLLIKLIVNEACKRINFVWNLWSTKYCQVFVINCRSSCSLYVLSCKHFLFDNQFLCKIIIFCLSVM
jgi:hypothetical protein